MILEKSNHLILTLKFSNQIQMILSCDFRKIESLDFDSRIHKKILQCFSLFEVLYNWVKVRRLRMGDPVYPLKSYSTFGTYLR